MAVFCLESFEFVELKNRMKRKKNVSFSSESLNNSAWKKPLEFKVRRAGSRCCLAKFQKSPWKDNPVPLLRQSVAGLLPRWLFFSPLDQ